MLVVGSFRIRDLSISPYYSRSYLSVKELHELLECVVYICALWSWRHCNLWWQLRISCTAAILCHSSPDIWKKKKKSSLVSSWKLYKATKEAHTRTGNRNMWASFRWLSVFKKSPARVNFHITHFLSPCICDEWIILTFAFFIYSHCQTVYCMLLLLLLLCKLLRDCNGLPLNIVLYLVM